MIVRAEKSDRKGLFVEFVKLIMKNIRLYFERILVALHLHTFYRIFIVRVNLIVLYV